MEKRHKVVIVGGGFAGLYAAKNLVDSRIEVTLVDKRNHHLFQPLLYQVATGGLSPGDIASPLRAVLKGRENFSVVQGEVTDIQPEKGFLVAGKEELCFDSLVLATGMVKHYFGNERWGVHAPGLKSVEDALEIRRRVLCAFEQAERATDEGERKRLLTFVIVGGGPTGVELAGALAELAYNTMKGDFANINPGEARIVLAEGMDRLLPAMPEALSERARQDLVRLGVEVRLGFMAQEIDGERVALQPKEGKSLEIPAATVMWAAGVKASPLGSLLADRTGAKCDKGGRVFVDAYLRVPTCHQVYVVGDLAHAKGTDGKPLPGLAPVAIQEGRYVARAIRLRLRGKSPKPFHYRNRGNLAVIGRNAAVADFGSIQLKGFPAWFIWAVVHIMNLVEFDNRIVVGFQWFWNYLTRKRGARLITDTALHEIHEKKGSDQKENE